MQKKSIAAILILAGAFAGQSVRATAQQTQATAPAAQQGTGNPDQDIAMLRQDLRSQRKQIVAANLQLTGAEATKFWPVYDQYVAELTKIGDTRRTLIKDYAQSYNTMPDEQAKTFIKQCWMPTSRRLRCARATLRSSSLYCPAKRPPSSCRWIARLSLLMDLQIASLVPMVQQ
jgi:hypothetical protein